MAKKKASKPSIKAEATARAELVAKATYQRKHSTTEVIPPDVTRAKASAWLDMISPITEWAGLKGDALRGKRALLRIQQEETLLRVAEAVLRRVDGKKVTPISTKILVPAIEKASLEEPSDSEMIARWAELLASASQGILVQPRFVGILGELAGSQALALEAIAFNNYKSSLLPYRDLEAAPYDFAQSAYTLATKKLVAETVEENGTLDEIVNDIVENLNRPGTYPELIVAQDDSGEGGYDSVRATGVRWESDFAVLESLGLIRRAEVEFDFIFRGGSANLSIYYFHLTHLGVDFCEVCARERVGELQAIGKASRVRDD